MRIIIVGCGKVGSALAEQLSADGHDLTLVDQSERRLSELANTRRCHSNGKWHKLSCSEGSGGKGDRPADCGHYTRRDQPSRLPDRQQGVRLPHDCACA